MEEMPIFVEVSSNKFPDILDRACVYNIITDEIKIKFVSNIKDITL